MVRKWFQGRIQLSVNPRGLVSQYPDAGMYLTVPFRPGRGDYYKDKILGRSSMRAEGITQPVARMAYLRKMFDRINTQYYVLPLARMPQTILHTKGIRVEPGSLELIGFELNRVHWN